MTSSLPTCSVYSVENFLILSKSVRSNEIIFELLAKSTFGNSFLNVLSIVSCINFVFLQALVTIPPFLSKQRTVSRPKPAVVPVTKNYLPFIFSLK